MFYGGSDVIPNKILPNTIQDTIAAQFDSGLNMYVLVGLNIIYIVPLFSISQGLLAAPFAYRMCHDWVQMFHVAMCS
jgi:hypothetical protein